MSIFGNIKQVFLVARISEMVRYIEPKDLAEKLLNDQEKVLIVDVRDSDYEVRNKIKILVLINLYFARQQKLKVV